MASARLSGLAGRLVAGFGEQPRGAALRLQADLEAGRDPHGHVAAAVAALHEVSTDPRAMTEAAAMYSPVATATGTAGPRCGCLPWPAPTWARPSR